jgi:hypothetical protein
MNDINGKEYKAGKAFHIYRPHIIDASGAETWGILHIENGIYSVEIPQDFLNTAVYPIRSNDTFGYTILGASAGYTLANSTNDTSAMVGITFNLANTGTFNRIYAGTKAGASVTGDIYLAIYREDSVGANSHGLVVGGELLNQNHSTTQTWFNVSVSDTELVADDYILAALVNGEDLASSYVCLAMDSGSGSSYHHYFESGTGAGSYAARKENPWTEIDENKTDLNSIYATYTPGGGGGTAPTPSVIIIE